MNGSAPDLDDLIRAHREGVHLSSEQRGRNRARLLARAAAGAAAAVGTVGASSTAVGAGTGYAAGALLAKVVIGLFVAGGAGAVYYVGHRSKAMQAPVAVEDLARNPVAEQAGDGVVSATPTEVPPELAPPPSADSESDGKATSAHRTSKPSVGNATSLAAEIQLMHDVETALQAGQPERALQLLDERLSGRYTGAMGEERAAARVVTLCRLGRVEEARAEAARFVHDRPRSPLVERVRSTCAKGGEPPRASGAK
jgi:hypothetical protein